MMVVSSIDKKILDYGYKIRFSKDYNGYFQCLPAEFEAEEKGLKFRGWYDGNDKLISQSKKIQVRRPNKGDIYYLAKFNNEETGKIIIDVYHVFAIDEGFNKPIEGIMY